MEDSKMSTRSAPAPAPGESQLVRRMRSVQHTEGLRRMSLLLGDNNDGKMVENMEVQASHAMTLGLMTVDDIKTLSKSYITCIKLSGVDVGDNVTTWFQRVFPSREEEEEEEAENHQTKRRRASENRSNNILMFLIQLAKTIRPVLKMSRIGVAVRISLSVLLGYFDMSTDLLVSFQYRDAGNVEWANMMVVFLIFSLFAQTSQRSHLAHISSAVLSR